jgi:hypothetical protein
VHHQRNSEKSNYAGTTAELANHQLFQDAILQRRAGFRMFRQRNALLRMVADTVRSAGYL